MNLLKILAFLSLFTACASPSLSPDLSLLRPWGEALQKEEPYKGSYIAKFQKGGRELLYVAGVHAEGADADVFPIIKRSLSEFDTEVLIVEGINPSVPEERMRTLARECAPSFEKCGEKFYAISLLSSKVKVQSGEPSEQSILDAMKSLDYSSHDLAFFYLVRQIPSLKRQKKLNDLDFKRQAEEYLFDTMSSRLKLQSINNSFETFLKWYKEKLGRNFSLADIDNETPAPHINGSYLQKLSYQVGVIRDSNVLKVIAEQLNTHKKVMVLYGSSHLPVQVKALEKMLGNPLYKK